MKGETRKNKSPTPLDPIKVEVIRNALISFIREMRHTIIRTSFGPSLRERHDFSCALQAPDGELVAIFQDNPPHIVPTVYAVHGVLERFGDEIQPGDIILINDPYILGGHMNDVTHLYPIFDGGRLILWIVIRLHYTDIGGMAAGSITPDSTDVYQEGIRIPAVKGLSRGRAERRVHRRPVRQRPRARGTKGRFHGFDRLVLDQREAPSGNPRHPWHGLGHPMRRNHSRSSRAAHARRHHRSARWRLRL